MQVSKLGEVRFTSRTHTPNLTPHLQALNLEGHVGILCEKSKLQSSVYNRIPEHVYIKRKV